MWVLLAKGGAPEELGCWKLLLELMVQGQVPRLKVGRTQQHRAARDNGKAGARGSKSEFVTAHGI